MENNWIYGYELSVAFRFCTNTRYFQKKDFLFQSYDWTDLSYYPIAQEDIVVSNFDKLNPFILDIIPYEAFSKEFYERASYFVKKGGVNIIKMDKSEEDLKKLAEIELVELMKGDFEYRYG